MDPGAGNLVSFAQFAFIALEGFIFTSKFCTQSLRIGYTSYLVLVAMFFIANVCNNLAFDFNIPMPLHMIIRAVSCNFGKNDLVDFFRNIQHRDYYMISVHDSYKGSLVTNMLMGIIILRRHYDSSKYLSVLMITLGIAICTIVSGSHMVNRLEFQKLILFFTNKKKIKLHCTLLETFRRALLMRNPKKQVPVTSRCSSGGCAVCCY